MIRQNSGSGNICKNHDESLGSKIIRSNMEIYSSLSIHIMELKKGRSSLRHSTPSPIGRGLG
jgi:hypothetical protein